MPQSWLRNLIAVAVVAVAAATTATGGANEPGPTFVVTKLAEDAEEVDANPGDGVCTTADGECTLRAAIQESNALAGHQAISLPPGENSLIRAGCCEDAAETGDLDITDDTTIVGAGADETAVTEIADFEGVERIFDIREGALVTISDLTIRGVYMNKFLPENEKCGGGIRNLGAADVLRLAIRDITFRGAGAGICNKGALRLRDSLLQSNLAALVGQGGGFLNWDGVAVLERVVVRGNQADTSGGGGIANTGTLTVRDSIIVDNGASARGTGGGGIENGQILPGASLTVVNSTISGNWTDSGLGGGGIANQASASATLINSTVTGNRTFGTVGGGLDNEIGSTTYVVNSLVGGNENGDCAGPITSGGHNLDGDGTCGLTSEGDLSNVDPMLGPLAGNGGPTQSHALLEGSPAIDAGGAGLCPATDQRGAPRPFDGDGANGPACDIGAYEYGSEPGPFPPPLSGDADCSATVEAVDSLSVLRHVARLPPRAACLNLGEVNCDTAIDAVDALLILRYVAALPVSLPPGCPPIGPP
ncbi:MAG TPA: choice-of-anchor Q domain-containing protein [Dehalococcoidia bacterium]|nr:choice-of-anchor Q domain-containing protein [Dehalococcoidia bacterium]